MALPFCVRQGLRAAAADLLTATYSSKTVKTHGVAEIAALEIHLHKHRKVLEVLFSTGERRSYSAEYLRVYSPAADSGKRNAKGQKKLVAGRKYVGILGVQPVGNYAISIKFDDLHDSGIFTWEYLHKLGQQKLSSLRTYIRGLQQQGLSRDPRRSSSSSSKG